MRKTIKPRTWPPNGSRVVLRRFLWLPESAFNRATMERERRWLEHATYLAEVVYWVNALTEVRTRWTFQPLQWLDTDEQREEVEQEGYNAYYLLQYQAWSTDGLEQELAAARQRVPPYLW